MRILLVFIAILATFGVLYGFAGVLHRSADTVGMLRPVFAVAILIGALATRRIGLRLYLGVFGLLALISVLLFLLPQAAGSDLRLYSKNLTAGNDQIAALQSDIEAANVDVVLLQELSGSTAELSTALSTTFPHQHVCKFSEWSAMAVFSRHPFAQDGVCSSERALAAVQITKDSQPVWVVSAHIPWPYPYENETAEIATEDLLRTLDGPIVVAGDFNTFPWSGRFERIRFITKTKIAGPTRPTLTFKHVPLPLDHVLAPNGGSVELRPLLGSDHRGLVADVGF
ncbi:MAG: endonuclease/exonuclease/phosphatase family protein [Tateyamaria sp.]|uniref:endonuclease/exonuclease/phosphatase family protein n=1 Tax=Tateyamaria sp. TaxID=1929288 RepID=UPI00329E1B2C